MTDFRALCAELLKGLDENRHEEVRYPGHLRVVMAEARAALAQPADGEVADSAQISDGYHTFAELYEHRHSLMLALMRAVPRLCWFSQRHADGELPFGSDEWFVAGAELSTGPITYHLPISMLSLARRTGSAELPTGRPWDGHTASDVIQRLQAWADATLAQPPADGEVVKPSDGELTQFLFESFRSPIEFICDAEAEAHLMIRNHVKFAHAVLARWGTVQHQPAIKRLPDGSQVIEPQDRVLLVPQHQPIPVSERLPEAGDCDAEGRCWWLKERANPEHDLLLPTWHLQRQGPAGTQFFRFTHWLPAHALPLPKELDQ